ncbi:MAG TPA: type VI secretion system tube protein Hcp [Candidatus Dormibacteraeota bacterium]
MAVDYFLKFDSIEGESTDFQHKGSIDLESFSWGVHDTISTAGGAARAGRPSFEDFHFTAATSKASPKMFIDCVKGTILNSATLSARKGVANEGGAPDFLTIKMEHVLISSYSEAGSHAGTDDRPMDAVSLNFGKITFTYVPQSPTGTKGEAVTESWDLRAQKA